MATLIGTDYASMQNMEQRVRLFAGTVEECEARAQYFREHKELGFGNLKVQG